MITILSIDSKKVKKQWQAVVTLSNGEVLALDPEVFAKSGLGTGDEVPEPEKNALLQENLKKQALNQALRWLAVRPQAAGELCTKLKRKGYEGVAEETISKLREAKYLDDGDFAKRYIKTRLLTKAIGTRAIEQELRAKGVSGHYIDAAIDELMDQETCLRLARKAVSRKLTGLTRENPLKKKEKLFRFLLQRGFDSEIIEQVLKEAGL